jgi:formylglycine-generating enzyme required for sulfatase activity
MQSSTLTTTPLRNHEEEALLHDKMDEAAVKCQDRFPELSKYLRMMRVIPAGTFIQGSDRLTKNSPRDEWPAHSVTLSAFGLGETPVSVAVWKEYCSTGLGRFPEVKRWKWSRVHPIVSISWDEIMGSDGKNGFCAWASEASGIPITLPTEAQFEYAARGGQYNSKFPWGDEFDDSKLWCSVVSQKSLTAPINRNTHIYRNGYELTDMIGNVWQWCYDLYTPYSRGEQANPMGPSVSKDRQRCMRGGSWVSEDLHVFTPTDRLPKPPDTKYSGCGFRIATNLM